MGEYTETAALLAVMEGDLSRAIELIDDLLPHERRRFSQHTSQLSSLIDHGCDTCGKTILDLRDLVSSGPWPLGSERQQWHHACGQPGGA